MEPLNLLYDSFKHKNDTFIINSIAPVTMCHLKPNNNEKTIKRGFFFFRFTSFSFMALWFGCWLLSCSKFINTQRHMREAQMWWLRGWRRPSAPCLPSLMAETSRR